MRARVEMIHEGKHKRDSNHSFITTTTRDQKQHLSTLFVLVNFYIIDCLLVLTKAINFNFEESFCPLPPTSFSRNCVHDDDRLV